jgi:hypothetical protein
MMIYEIIQDTNNCILDYTNIVRYLFTHKTKEAMMKVYVINLKMLTEDDKLLDLSTISDDDFIKICMKSGDVYTLRGFENASNQDDFDSLNSYIRII